MAARGRAINGNIGMSAPGQKCELRSCAEDSLQSVVRAIAFDHFSGASRIMRRAREDGGISASRRHPGLPDSAFYIRFDHLVWSAKNPTKPIIAALEFNPNRQARTL
jgi:hypothetical protein